jgi:phospholipid/cholesterol/gamma-HCH transport system substrate-binding protein
METRANYIAVGFFTLVAVVAVFAVIYWFGRYGDNDNLVPVDIRIQGSVSGLGPASVVQFNGISVGHVDTLSLDRTDPRFVIVHVLVSAVTPLRSNTKATIGIRGLSGGAFIQLEGGSPNLPALLETVQESGEIPVLQGDPSAFADLVVRINAIAERTEGIMDTLETFVAANSRTVTRTLQNAETFSRALADNSDSVADFLSSAGDVAGSLKQLSAKLDSSLKRVEEILYAVDPQSVENTIENVELFTRSLADQRNEITVLVETVKQTADQLNGFTKNLNVTMAKVDNVVSAVDPQIVSQTLSSINRSVERAEELVAAFDGEGLNQTIVEVQGAATQAGKILASVDEEQVRSLIADLSQASADASNLLKAVDAAKINDAVDSITSAAQGAQSIVDDVSKVTKPFGERAADIDQIVTDASELAGRLNEASKKVDGIMTKVDDLVGSDATEGMIADVRRTLDQFRQTARNFDIQVSSVANSINAFTKRGLADTQGLIRDARQSINQIDRVMRNLQSNPSSLITGAGSSRVKETSGGRVRR